MAINRLHFEVEYKECNMSNISHTKKRLLHWTVATAFALMVLTGLTLLIPALSGLAAGGWTRLVHKIAAVVLIGSPVAYALLNRSAAGRWMRDAAVWRKDIESVPHFVHAWRRRHKLIMSLGAILFAATGIVQWFLKGIVPSGAFNVSLLLHDVLLYAALLVLIYHVYFELYWLQWRRRYCSRCTEARCAGACPVNAISTTRERRAERNMQLCNNCLLCMKECQRNGYFLETVMWGGEGK